MNNEIKEILNYLKDDSKSFIICGSHYYKISDYKAKVLLDYITNLQEEKDDYKFRFNLMANFRDKGLAREWEYKSRIDKAREMIRFITYNSERPLTITELNKVYNILGGDE